MTNDDSDYRHIESTYDEGADDYSAYHSRSHEAVEPERQRFTNMLPPGASLLDCGCGPGMETERFGDMGYAVTAIDLSDRFVELTRRRVPGARVSKMDMRHLEFALDTFDGIWASFSLLHIPARDLAITLAEFARVLKPRGLLFVALHRGARTRWVKARVTAMQRDTFIQEWASGEFEVALTTSGFEVLSSRQFERAGGEYPLLAILAQAE